MTKAPHDLPLEGIVGAVITVKTFGPAQMIIIHPTVQQGTMMPIE